jgi:indolepyruvate decarboxylase
MTVKTKSPVKTLPVGQYLLDRLHSYGVEHIFGIPGDYVLQFDKMIEEHPIHFINTTRENTAGFMADAYARTRGLGAACITYGVGINITNAVSQAFVENSPVVIISGAASTKEFLSSQRLHHLFNKPLRGRRDETQLEIFKKITVAQTVLENPETAASEIDRVLGECLCQKKPVYIELPRDQVTAPVNYQRDRIDEALHPGSSQAALSEVLGEIKGILKNCRRPVIWAGHELQRFALADSLLHFAEKYHIPIVTSLLGKSTISENHPLFVGLYQGRMSREEVSSYVESCDCILILGVVFNDVDTGMFTANLENLQKIIASTETISINHHQYNDIFLKDLIDSLSTLDLNIRFKDDYPASIDRGVPAFKPEAAKMTTTRLFECLQSHLSHEHMIVSDFGDCLFGSAELTVEQNSFFSNAFFATLGFGVPGAIAVQIANPGRRVISLVGDGAFQMTCMELSTAIRYGADPIVILLNNHGYATERPLLEGKFNDIGNWNYASLPQVLNGGVGFHVKTEAEFEKALLKSLSARGQYYLIEVELGKADFSPALKRFCKLVEERRKSTIHSQEI